MDKIIKIIACSNNLRYLEITNKIKTKVQQALDWGSKIKTVVEVGYLAITSQLPPSLVSPTQHPQALEALTMPPRAIHYLATSKLARTRALAVHPCLETTKTTRTPTSPSQVYSETTTRLHHSVFLATIVVIRHNLSLKTIIQAPSRRVYLVGAETTHLDCSVA